MEDLGKIKKVAVEAAVEAGKYALSRVGCIEEISYKEGVNNLVTDVDKKCEKLIIDKIKEDFPTHSILAEESGNEDGDISYKWVIDPIDGTTNYTHAFPFFCVSIGFFMDGSAKVGVVYEPSRDELFVAEEGKGALLNGKKISVSKNNRVQDSLIATGFAYTIEGKIDNIDDFLTMLRSARAVRRAGSAAIDLCYVACGRFDGFWEKGLAPWDTAAGQLMIKEAGGMVTTLGGDSFDIYKKEILATNSEIHREMMSLLG